MVCKLTRRSFGKLAGATMLAPAFSGFARPSENLLRIRAITAGVPVTPERSMEQVQDAATLLDTAREKYRAAGYEVQSIRIATQFVDHLDFANPREGLVRDIKEMDEFCVQNEIMFSLGRLRVGEQYRREVPATLASLISDTGMTNISVDLLNGQRRLDYAGIRTAAESISRLSRATPMGADNFRFAATASLTPGPFFPGAYHTGGPALSVGLESANLVRSVFEGGPDTMREASAVLRKRLDAELAPVAALAEDLCASSGRRFLGVDPTPAPGLDASIGEAIETLSGVPFGSASTLAACAAITEALAGVDVPSCGYAGLFLPVLEDRVLAKRATEGRYDLADLLSYSSVCGTGLDVVPLPGDTTPDELGRIIHDVAALAAKYEKPLSARLFPVPGKKAGDAVDFPNPYLVEGVAMKVD